VGSQRSVVAIRTFGFTVLLASIKSAHHHSSVEMLQRPSSFENGTNV